MIDKKDIAAYMSIKAPESIKERIIAEQSKKNNRISSIVHGCYAVAAALIVFIAIFAFLPDGKTALYYGDTLIDGNTVVVKTMENPNARIALLSIEEAQKLPLTIETDEKTVVTVSNGSILIPSGEQTEDMGQKIEIDSDTELLWSVELVSHTDVYTLTVESDGKKNVYSISENSEAQWVLLKK
ncbi:MAG: hypothetical protein IKL05_00745 [Clostridia bacterium]|nr:hypothetical protein [Clostridia bacterium]